eukprot:768106-Hanusia_phi.AAC.4
MNWNRRMTFISSKSGANQGQVIRGRRYGNFAGARCRHCKVAPMCVLYEAFGSLQADKGRRNAIGGYELKGFKGVVGGAAQPDHPPVPRKV